LSTAHHPYAFAGHTKVCLRLGFRFVLNPKPKSKTQDTHLLPTAHHLYALAGHTKAVHCCAWNSLLKVIASGSADRKVLLWNPFSCRSLGTLDGHSAPVMCLASNERDMQIISAAADNTVKVRLPH
jgi:WD40 repeat protein